MAIPFHDERPTPRTTWGTWLLLIACVVVFAYFQPKPMQGLTHGLSLHDQSNAELSIRHYVDRWALVPCEITHGRSIADGAACRGYPVDDPGAYAEKNVWIPLITAMFLHANLMHLLGNMIYLWVFGRGLEEKLGSWGVLALFLAGGLASFLGYVALNPESSQPLLGASGAIAALMGAYLVLQPNRRLLSFVYAAGVQVLYLPAWAVLGFFFVSQFFTSPGSGVAWQAHVTGMLFGIVVAVLCRYRAPWLKSQHPLDDPLAGAVTSSLAQSGIAAPANDIWPTSPPPSPPADWAN